MIYSKVKPIWLVNIGECYGLYLGVPHYHWIVFTIVLFLSILGTCLSNLFLYWVYHTTMKIAMNHYQSLVITITPRKNAIPKHQRTRLWRP